MKSASQRNDWQMLEAYAVIEAAKAEREAATLRAEAQKMLAEATSGGSKSEGGRGRGTY